MTEKNLDELRKQLDEAQMCEGSKWTYIQAESGHADEFIICHAMDGDPLEFANTLEEALELAEQISYQLEEKRIQMCRKAHEEKKYYTVERFWKICRINGIRTSVETIEKRYKEIPGIEKENGYRVLGGTRYPMKKVTVKDTADRKYYLLKAIDDCRYAGCEMLGIYQNEFELYLKQMLQAGLIEENASENTFGANAYTITDKGSEVISHRKQKAVREITDMIAEISGTFTGAVISTMI